jgi:hypothetical protein
MNAGLSLLPKGDWPHERRPVPAPEGGLACMTPSVFPLMEQARWTIEP